MIPNSGNRFLEKAISWPGWIAYRLRRQHFGFRENSMNVNFAMSGRAAVVVAMTALMTTPTFAQGLIIKKRLSAALAMEAVMEAVDTCKKNGYAVTATVVDNEGVRQAVIRGDGATVHTLDSAYAKAYTAASLAPVRKDGSTKGLSERIAKTPGVSTAGLASLPYINFTPGGVTILAGDEAIGGLGVAGAPGGNFDHDCAVAALDKIKDRMK
jgi:uncharacterized protein GlcG (DUF336 family)